MALPAFTPEYALLLESKPMKRKGEDPFAPDQSMEWTLELATAARQLVFLGPPTFKLEIRKNVPIDRKRIIVNEPLALSIQRAWLAVLRLTRYPESTDHLGNDGVTYQFCANGMYGETWSPHNGLPQDTVGLAQKLIKLITVDVKDRERLTAECINDAKRLEAAASAAAEMASIKIGLPTPEPCGAQPVTVPPSTPSNPSR